jgi:hypothetical protein
VNPAPDTPAWIRCRLRVDGGAIGVSLLTADESAFTQSQVVSPGDGEVLLAVPDVGRRGRLVIHTWDAPVPAQVRVEDLSLLW